MDVDAGTDRRLIVNPTKRVAVTVSGELPGGVEEVVEKTLSEREREVELDAGLYDAEAPAGSPLTLSETGPLKP